LLPLDWTSNSLPGDEKERQIGIIPAFAIATGLATSPPSAAPVSQPPGTLSATTVIDVEPPAAQMSGRRRESPPQEASPAAASPPANQILPAVSVIDHGISVVPASQPVGQPVESSGSPADIGQASANGSLDPDQAPPQFGAAAEADAGPENEIVVLGRNRRGDPLEPLNAQSFEATQAVDKAFFGPVAMAYKRGLPAPIRSGLRNFLGNLREPVVAANYLLQLKPGKAGETLGRFVVNTTAGVAGLIDVAKRRPFNLPRRRNGFANTLGYYGVKPGPFFFMPLIGPTTLRDLIGNGLDQVAGPLNFVEPFNQQSFIIPAAVLSALDYRAEFDEELGRLRASGDPYAAVRRYYLDARQAEIDALRGRGAPVPTASGPATTGAPAKP
jgi:phospholipid-binding lipoprotein MlaA